MLIMLVTIEASEDLQYARFGPDGKNGISCLLGHPNGGSQDFLHGAPQGKEKPTATTTATRWIPIGSEHDPSETSQ